MMEEEKQIVPVETAPEKPKTNIISSAKHFIGTALSPLKSKDSIAQIEEFTSEMTLVAEGLSEDQLRISRLLDNVAAEQTTFEKDTEDHFRLVRDELEEQEKALKGQQDTLKAVNARLDKLDKALADKKLRKVDGWTGLVRALTWLVGIAAGSGIIITLLNKLL